MSFGLIVFLALQAAQPTEIAESNLTPIATEEFTISPAKETETPAPKILPKDTPVHLMVVNEVTTKTHQAGHRFKLRVNKSVMLNGQIILPVWM